MFGIIIAPLYPARGGGLLSELHLQYWRWSRVSVGLNRQFCEYQLQLRDRRRRKRYPAYKTRCGVYVPRDTCTKEDRRPIGPLGCEGAGLCVDRQSFGGNTNRARQYCI